MLGERQLADSWTDTEINLIVADYFAMLGDELEGNSFNKAEHNRSLQELVGRDVTPSFPPAGIRAGRLFCA